MKTGGKLDSADSAGSSPFLTKFFAFFYCCKCNFPMSPHFRLLVGWMVFLSVSFVI